MAESAVKSAANGLGKLIVEEGTYLWGVEDKVKELRNELIWMQGFLRDADALQYDDEIIALWVLQIKEYVCEAEDIVDKFVIEVASCRRQSSWVNNVKRWSCIGMELFALHQIGSKIDSLKLRISALTPKLQTYGLKTAYGMKTYRIQEALSEQTQQRMSYAHLESKSIVGLEQDTEMIVDALLNSKAERMVVAIYGMGGLGKTTLATKVYNHHKIGKHFICGCAWVYISKQFQVQNVLQKLIADLTSKSADMMAGKSNEALIRELREFIRKNKCLVVLDDVWEPIVWDSLEAVFPPNGVESGSKVLLTTRKKDVAQHAGGKSLPKPDPLKEDESWELLQLTLGWGIGGNQGKKNEASHNLNEISARSQGEQLQTDTGERNGEKNPEMEVKKSNGNKEALTDEVDSSYKHGLEMFGNDVSEVIKLGKEIVKHCNGIPLAIVVLGGILRKKESVNEWRLVRENITSYLRRGNDHGRSYMEVLVLSYNDLPYHLKPCFLHLGNFPEDYEIRTEKLYRMWVAEGLVSRPHDRVSSTESLEDIANSYLSELAQVGMVQIMSKGSNGRIKSIRVHDLMRDVCLQKAATENFLSIIDHRPCPNEPQSLSSSLVHTRLLHMAIYLAEGVTNYLPDFLTSKAHEYLRSLLLFAGQAVQGAECETWMTSICNDFPWLWVLDVEGLRCVKGKLSGDVQKMIRLRYLNLKGTDISELPSSIGNMRFLQTLDLRVSFAGSVKIPNTLWKLEQLRHLFLPKKPYEIKKSEFCRLDTLVCLETLKNLEVGKFQVEDLQKLRKLKKFSIKGFVSEGESLKNIVESSAAKSGCLRTCSIGVKGSILDRKPSILSNFNCLHRLDVTGKISFLEDNVLPQSLQVLSLEYCALKNDPMRIMGSLRHLKDLLLGHNSFVGKEMICEAESFPQLTMLNLQWLANLEDWTLKQKSMSRLKKLIIMDCGRLKMIPDGLPSSVRVTCSPCINGIERYGTCNYYGATFGVDDLDIHHIERANDTKSLVNLLVNDHSKKVVLTGLSGVGKATLARMLYHQPEIKKFFDAIAWAHYPYRQIPRSLIQMLLRQFDPAHGDKQYSSENSDITVKLKEVMQRKKCLVILIDLASSLEDLDVIIGADIPKGSKILITTVPNKPDIHYQRRLSKVESLDMKRKLGGSVSDSDTYHVKPFLEDESWDLFKRRLGGALSGNDADIKVELGKSMLQHISGHPLSIIMLAGLLTMKKSLIEWQNIQKEVNLRQEKAQGPQLIYALSYDDLPTHLKLCFLYLANFPQGTEISSSKLYCMWIAAGLVRLKDDQDSSKRRKDSAVDQTVKLLENVAASNLEELVLRGMVQVVKRGPSKRICTCRLHSSLQNLCLEKARDGQFVNVVVESSVSASGGSLIAEHDQIEGEATKCIALQRLCLGKAARKKHVAARAGHVEPSNERIISEHLSVHLNQHLKEVVPNSTYVSDHQLKSLLLFPEVSDTSIKEYNWDWFIKICNHFQFLWVLDLEGMWMTEGALPAEVGTLSQLRYLSLKETWVNDLPLSIQQLTNLQTLDLRVRGSAIVPDVLCNLQNLRHLYLPDSFSLKHTKLRLHGLNNLQALANLHTDKVDLDCVAELKNLRKILINNIHPENELDDKLKSISARLDLTINSNVLNVDSSILSNFHNLNNMTIKGRISGSSLHDGLFPKMLKELKLKHTELLDDPIPILRQLPGVTHLFLDHDSFLGKKLTFSLGFPRLTHLTLRLLSILEELDMTEADHLRHIEPVIIDCWRLEVKVPTGAEIEVGPLSNHPLMELLDLQQ